MITSPIASATQTVLQDVVPPAEPTVTPATTTETVKTQSASRDFLYVDMSKIKIEPSKNIRKDMGDIPSFAASLIDETTGKVVVRVPLVVRCTRTEKRVTQDPPAKPTKADPADGPTVTYILVDGHRRMTAIKWIKENRPEIKIPALPVRSYDGTHLNPEDRIMEQLVYANGKGLSIFEKADALAELLKGSKDDKHARKEIIRQWGVSPTFIANLETYISAPSFLRKMVLEKRLTGFLARELTDRFKSSETIKRLVEDGEARAIAARKNAPALKDNQVVKILPKHIPELLAARERTRRDKPEFAPKVAKRFEDAKVALIHAKKHASHPAMRREAEIAELALRVAAGKDQPEALLKFIGLAPMAGAEPKSAPAKVSKPAKKKK